MTDHLGRSVASLFAVPLHILGVEPEPRDRCEEGRMRLVYYDAMGVEPGEFRDRLASAAWMERQLWPLGLDAQPFWDSALKRCPLPARLRREPLPTPPKPLVGADDEHTPLWGRTGVSDP